MKVYLDSNFLCHLNNNGGYTEYNLDDFNDMCETYIEGYRVIPEGCTWVREDGIQFHGFMVTPARPYNELQIAQDQYEKDNNKMQDLNDVKEIIDLLYIEDTKDV